MNNQLVRLDQVHAQVDGKIPVYQQLLGSEAEAKKFATNAYQALKDPNLEQCNLDSVIFASVQVAQLGLDISPVRRQCYIVPFKGRAQLIVSATGYINLLAKTGWKVKAYIVKNEDEFKYYIDGFDTVVKFTPNLDADTDNYRFAVAIAKAPTGELFVEVMPMRVVEKHRMESRGQDEQPSGVWFKWRKEMYLKTVIKKLAKSLPIGEEVANAIAVDDGEEIGSPVTIEDGNPKINYEEKATEAVFDEIPEGQKEEVVHTLHKNDDIQIEFSQPNQG